MSQRDIERLRALEIELRNEAEAKQLESQDKNWSEWVRDRAHGRSAGLHEAANRIQQLIAELGQEVGAVADERLCDFFADVGEVARFMDELCNVVTELTGDEGEDDPITVLRRYIASSPAHTSEARDAAGLVAAAKRLDKFSLVILSSVAMEDPEFSERVGAALVDLRNAAHADPCAVKYRKALERIFDCGRFPEGHHSAGDHEFCGSHHADCIAIAREALSEDAAMRQEGGNG